MHKLLNIFICVSQNQNMRLAVIYNTLNICNVFAVN